MSLLPQCLSEYVSISYLIHALASSLELNCLRKFGSMKAVNLCGLFKVSFYQEISVFVQQKSGEREWKENMKKLQIMLTLKSQVKNYCDVLKALPPTSISISSLTFKPIKHEHWRENGQSPLDTHLLPSLTAAHPTSSSRHAAPQLLLLPCHQNTCSSDIVSKFVSRFLRKLLRLVSERELTTTPSWQPMVLAWYSGEAVPMFLQRSLPYPIFNMSFSFPCCLYLG